MELLKAAIERLTAALDEYERDYRNPKRDKFDRGVLYALFPEEAKVPTQRHWDMEWEYSERTGVYVIFGATQVLYVGTACKLGRRLACYFQYEFPGVGQKCRIVHEWQRELPAYVVTIAVPGDSTVEAASLEQYLIARLDPCNNTRGRLTDVA